MQNIKPKILIVEDMPKWQRSYAKALGDVADVLSAYSIQEAQDLFAQNRDVALIVMDACVPGDVPTTLPLVGRFRKHFKGPMIAASSLSDYRDRLVVAGCDLKADKADVVNLVLQLLSGVSVDAKSSERPKDERAVAAPRAAVPS